MRVITLASAVVDRACLTLAKLALILMVLTILLQIWARYGFDYPFTWTEELARYLMVWAGLLGATCAFKRQLDPAVTKVSEEASLLRRQVALTMLFLTVTVFLTPVIYYSVFGPGMNIERGFLWRSSNRISPGLNLNMGLVGSIVPISCSIVLLHLLALVTGRDKLR